MTIASIAFYPPLAPAAVGRRPAASLPYPLGEDDAVVVSRGRHAIWLAARALGLGPEAGVLAPAWHHGAEIEALRRRGAAITFYDLDDRLEPDADELDALLEPRTRALFITHYLGFAQDAARWRAWADERGLLLIEDAAHACLTRTGGEPVGSFGQAAIWCLFKSFAVPDGAALRIAGGAPTPAGAGTVGAAAAGRRQAQWILQRAPALAHALDTRSSANGHYDHGAEIALGQACAPLATTSWLLPRVADATAAARRRANYALLLDELGEQVPPPFDRLPDGAVPLGFPIASAEKRATLRRLAERGIDGVDFWSQPHPLAADGRFPRAAPLRRSTVLLPVHQELRPSDLERIAAAARTRGAADTLRLEITDQIAELWTEWSQLAERSGNVFASPEWAEVWCRHFLGGRPLRLLAFRNAADRLVAVVPTYVFATRPLTVLRLVGHGPGDELGPVCDPADRPAVARALRRALPQLGADLLLAEHVSARHAWSAMTGGRPLRTESSPAIRLAGMDWPSFVGSRSRRLRKELRRVESKLAAGSPLHIRDPGPQPADLDAELTTLFELHDACWGERSTFLRDRAFHRDFARTAVERGWFRLVFLDAPKRPVAATYGFRYAGVESDYQGGRDPSWDSGSPGFMLLAWMIRAACEAGVREYRLLRGGHWYKHRFATDDAGVETFALGAGALGSAAATIAAHLPEAVADPLRRRLTA
jgi:dTDP-4-amino-4,6-dideoxygalactose transaminase